MTLDRSVGTAVSICMFFKMGFKEQYKKENAQAKMYTRGCPSTAVTEYTSNPLGGLPGTHLR